MFHDEFAHHHIILPSVQYLPRDFALPGKVSDLPLVRFFQGGDGGLAAVYGDGKRRARGDAARGSNGLCALRGQMGSINVTTRKSKLGPP